MRKLTILGLVTTTLTLAAFVGCGNSDGNGAGGNAGTLSTTKAAGTTTGATTGVTTGSHTGVTTGSHTGATTATSSTSSAMTTTTASTTSTGTTSGTGGAGGAAMQFAECTVAAPAPSKGACVTVVVPDAGADAAVPDGGPTVTECNPVTNAGCMGTDICAPDANNAYVCFTAGMPANVAVCGDCSAPNASCAPGSLCVGISATMAECVALCCTDADCGKGKCNTMGLQTPLPSGVGICTAM